ncbi:MAG: hypothetical protein RIC16_05745 [Rhodospirillales bacterium]
MADDDGRRIELRMGSAVQADAATGQGADDASGGTTGAEAGTGGGHAGAAGQAFSQAPRPVMGWIAVACGILGIFTYGIIFVPIAFVCSIIALFMGQGMWAFLGFLTAFAGLITSPGLLFFLGLGGLAAYFGIPL